MDVNVVLFHNSKRLRERWDSSLYNSSSCNQQHNSNTHTHICVKRNIQQRKKKKKTSEKKYIRRRKKKKKQENTTS
jgi:hypothetical protein